MSNDLVENTSIVDLGKGNLDVILMLYMDLVLIWS